jgi:hypothetical protein
MTVSLVTKKYTPMSPPTKYTGSCHCGAVRYEVTVDLGQTVTCNCSLCSKAGYLLAFAPADQFVFLSGEDHLTDYQFNKMIIHHVFCKTCGVRSFGRGVGHDGKPTVAINVRCLDGVDISALSPMAYDGKSL